MGLWVKAAFMIKATHTKRKCASDIARLSVVEITYAFKYIFIICERAGFSSPCHFGHLCEAARTPEHFPVDFAVRHWW